MHKSLIALGAMIMALTALPAASQPVYLEGGVLRVTSGDSLQAAGFDIQLAGIYAPEPGVLYGHTAQTKLAAILAGESVRCSLTGQTGAQGREIAHCTLRDQDLSAVAVKAGAALDCTAQSGGAYKAMEQQSMRDRVPLPAHCR